MNPYKILGVTKNATDKEVRSAYLELAKIYHPDKHIGDKEKREAEDKFKEINEAYYEIKEERITTNIIPDKKEEPTQTTYESAVDRFEHIKNVQTVKSKQTSYSEFIYKEYLSAKDCIYKRKDGAIIFLFRDYSMHQIGNEKLKKRTLLLIKDGVEYEYYIYTDIDNLRLTKDDKYREYIIENLFSNSKLNKFSEKVYGYMGKTQQNSTSYTQVCDYRSLEILRQKSFLDEYRVKKDNGTIIGLRKLYRQNENGEELNIYILKNYSLEGVTSRIIKSNINLSRMQVNEVYRNAVISSYLTKDGEYVGNPEQDYKLGMIKDNQKIKSTKHKENGTFIKIDTPTGAIFVQNNNYKDKYMANKFKVKVNSNIYEIYANLDVKKLLCDEEYKKVVSENMLNGQKIEDCCIRNGGYIGHIVSDENRYKVVEDKKTKTILSEYANANIQVYKNKRNMVSFRKIGEHQDGKGIFVIGQFDEKSGLTEKLVKNRIDTEKMQRDIIYRTEIIDSLYETSDKDAEKRKTNAQVR